MIPPSYFFRQAYRDRFEEAEPLAAAPPPIPGRPAIDLVTAAILAFSCGMARLALAPNPELRHDRRR